LISPDRWISGIFTNTGNRLRRATGDGNTKQSVFRGKNYLASVSSPRKPREALVILVRKPGGLP
jgi:hypothetical protein